MYSFEEFLQWFFFSFPICFSPGPANIYCTDLGRRFGIKRSLPFVLGILTIVGAYSILAGIFSNFLMHEFSMGFKILRIAGCFYLFFLCYKLFNSSKKIKSSSDKEDKPPRYIEGVLFQMVNVKYITFAIMCFTQFLDLDEPSFYEILYLTIGNLTMSCCVYLFWLRFGKLIVTKYNSPRALKIQNYIFSLALFIVSILLTVESIKNLTSHI